MAIFDYYARYYDLIYAAKDYAAEIDYLHSHIREHKAGAASILEMGCGTGVHAELFAKRGYKVHGIDQSQVMLQEATRRWSQLEDSVRHKLTSEQGDMRVLQCDASFDVVVALFHVMSYLPGNEDIHAAFTSAANNLERGGLLLFDFWYGPAVLTDRPEEREKILEDECIRAVRHASPVMYPNENLVEINYKIHVTDKSTGQEETVEERHTMRYLFMPELKHYLSKAGFEVVFVEQWMTGKPLGFDAWYGFIVAKKL